MIEVLGIKKLNRILKKYRETHEILEARLTLLFRAYLEVTEEKIYDEFTLFDCPNLMVSYHPVPRDRTVTIAVDDIGPQSVKETIEGQRSVVFTEHAISDPELWIRNLKSEITSYTHEIRAQRQNSVVITREDINRISALMEERYLNSIEDRSAEVRRREKEIEDFRAAQELAITAGKEPDIKGATNEA